MILSRSDASQVSSYDPIASDPKCLRKNSLNPTHGSQYHAYLVITKPYGPTLYHIFINIAA